MTNRDPFWFTQNSSPPVSVEARLRQELEAANQRIRELNEAPSVYAAVVATTDKRCTLVTGNQILELVKPKSMTIAPGIMVRMQASNGGGPPAILEIVQDPPVLGSVALVKQVIDKSCVEIAIQNQSRSVMYPPGMKIKASDQVVLDFSSSIVVKNLGSGDKSRLFTEATGVSWDDIGGLDDVKKLLREAIEEPITHATMYKRYKRRPTRGVLLFGPPGTGKTLLAAAAATALARTHGTKPSESGYIYVRGPEILDKYVGGSEGGVRSLFAAAREHKMRAGYPAIIFIDEADAIMGKRGRMSSIEGMERTVVPQFLAEMDGLEDAGCMVLLATNRPDTIDPAITRRGRVDRKIHVRRPNQAESESIFKIYLKDLPMAEDVTVEKLAVAGAKYIFDTKYRLYIFRTKSGKDEPFTFSNLISGAEIAGLVDDIAQMALRRERDGDSKQVGIQLDDVKQAVQDAVKEQASLNHESEIKAFIEDNKINDVIKLEKVTM